jgi:hypothetical protein
MKFQSQKFANEINLNYRITVCIICKGIKCLGLWYYVYGIFVPYICVILSRCDHQLSENVIVLLVYVQLENKVVCTLSRNN